MAGAGLLMLLDDIAAILDDVALMTKVAARKSVVTGVRAEREIPVVWAVAKGSLINKAILVPAALLISAFIPWAITPLLMAGGAFLCFEGCEKLAHKFLHSPEEDAVERERLTQANADAGVDLVAMEKDKIKGAVRTDFILSAEIIAITLGTVASAPFGQQVAVLAGIAVIMTLGVYGLVAGIVKLDDLGLWLGRRASAAAQALGRGIVAAAPWLMKGLSVAGTAAMFLVGGGILVHGVPALHHAVEGLGEAVAQGALGGLWRVLAVNLLNALAGLVAGAVVLAAVQGIKRLRSR
jgi:predicted DNA repair protein MutK